MSVLKPELREPGQIRGRGKPAPETDYEAAALARRNPGQFVVVPDHGRKVLNMTSNVKKGKLRAFEPEGAFDATSRNGELFVKFVG